MSKSGHLVQEKGLFSLRFGRLGVQTAWHQLRLEPPDYVTGEGEGGA